MNITHDGLKKEVTHALQAGMVLVAPATLDEMLEGLGYIRDRSMRCVGVSTNLSNGNRFPNIHFVVKEKDTGRGAMHYEARRDENFSKLQELRRNIFCVVGNSWWGV
jgi:hypothetical protein